MKAIILAGGDGKRLRPLTCTMPKPLVPLLNKPILIYTLELLKDHGILDVVITIGYMAEEIKKQIGDGSALGMRITYSNPEKRLGTAGSVREAAEGIDDSILVMSGDGITDADLSSAIAAHRDKKADATVILYRVNEPTEYGIALKDKDGFIVRFIEKPARSDVFSDLANTGMYILEREIVERIPRYGASDFSRDIFPILLEEKRRILGWQMQGYWCDIGSIAQYNSAQRDMLNGLCRFRTSARQHDGIFIEHDAKISTSAKLFAPCYIGSDVEIGPNVCIEPHTVLCSGVRLLDGVSVKRSVVLKKATIRNDSEIRGAVICENVEVGERSTVFEGSVVGAGSVLESDVSVTNACSIWPHKHIPKGKRCRSNIVWGTGESPDHSDACFNGYGDTNLTPSEVLSLAAAYASRFTPPCSICVGADGSPVSVMLKHSAVSGVISTGVDAVTVPAVGRTAFKYSVRETNSSGGIYIECNTNSRMVKMHIVNGKGVEADDDTMRSIVRAVEFDEQKPKTDAEIGIVMEFSGAELAFESRLLRTINPNDLLNNKRRLILNANAGIQRSISRVLLRLGWDVDSVRCSSKLITARERNTISILCDDDERLSVSMAPDTTIDEQSLMCIIIYETSASGRKIPVPADIAVPLEKHMISKGYEPILLPNAPAKRRHRAMEKGIYIPELLEPEIMILKICEMFALGKLEAQIKQLPIVFKTERELSADSKDIGRTLRSIVESASGIPMEMIDGVRLRYDTGWVVVRPESDGRRFKVAAGSTDSEYSKELCDIYLEKLKNMQKD